MMEYHTRKTDVMTQSTQSSGATADGFAGGCDVGSDETRGAAAPERGTERHGGRASKKNRGKAMRF